MQVTPSGERPFPTPPTPNAQDLESARFADRDTVVLPDEMVVRIVVYLGTTDIAVCRRVSRQWQTAIDARHLLARSFYRDCHLTQRINSLAPERNLAVERYHSHFRGWLANFGNGGRETVKQLDNTLEDKYFPEVLFFSIPNLLLNSNELTYQNTATIGYSGVVRDASFSPDGKYLVTVSNDDPANHAELWELEGGQWREKVTLRYSSWRMSASFSLDSKLLVIASDSGICKIWRLEDDKWQEKDTIQHPNAVRKARFSPDGKHLVVVPIVYDGGVGFVKIWRHVDGEWQEKFTINQSGWGGKNAQFSPDGKHLVTTSFDGTIKIWKIDDGQWKEKFIIHERHSATSARFSPDGNHLVTATFCGLINYVKLWELVDDQSQENVTIQRWQEKFTMLHSDEVNNVHFSPDGKHFVTASRDRTAKICGLVDSNWLVKATIRHSGPVANASFSRDGKLLVTASHDHTAKICGPVGGKWQEIVTIEHSKKVTNARFSPDYQLVTASRKNPAKIWMLKNRENDDNSRTLSESLEKHTIK